MGHLRRAVAAASVSVLVAGFGVTALPASAGTQAEARRGLTTPQLIDAAVAAGRISRATGDVYLARALGPNWEAVPAAYQSDVPWEGTVPLLHLRERFASMPAGPERDALAAPGGAGSFCDFSVTPMLENVQTDHFYVEYNSATIGGNLTITDYTTSLETTWGTEVDDFGWAAPPVLTSAPPPGNKYHVRIDELSPAIYGFVSSLGTHAGDVGDNPNTAWDDEDAIASCMVLNRDFSNFPGTPQAAMDATTAHEFNHSIQFGYGGLSGPNVPDDAYVEGGATWMEDEAMDAADDNYNYLWPNFEGSMGEYVDSPYPYWITFRGLTEQFGAGVAGGGEQVMQDFWEETSKNSGDNLTAMQTALANQGTNLEDAYHAYAIAARFTKTCGGQFALPYCFEEAAGYVAAAGANASQHTIAAVGDAASGSVQDAYALNWVDLPTGADPYSLTLENDDPDGGELRATVVCDTGTSLLLQPFPSVAGPTESTAIGGYSADGCTSAVAVITNQAQTEANPTNTPARAYTLTSAAPLVPLASISDAQTIEGDRRTRKMPFLVTLSSPADEVVSVEFTVADGSATEGVDFEVRTVTLNFPVGVTSMKIKARALGDRLVEDDETFTVTLVNPNGLAIGRATGTGVITDND